MHVKHLQVKLRDGVTRITVLFDKNVPDTVVRYGTAAMLACGVLSIAHIKTERTIKGASGDLPDTEKGTTKVIWEWGA
jgi:hypothetical protein